ncbi:MAG TPA: hypothetical protein VK176_02630 [Phycisphaerales bacterium]|nr:hypothetical protein [Phycisphaerales bacterium]
MDVYLDDVALTIPNASLAEVLDAARERAQAAGRLIVEVLFDGRRPSDAELAAADAPDVREVRCRSADPAELIAATLEDAAGELDLLIADQRRACESLWIGRVSDAMENLRDILERWKLVRGGLEQCAQALSLPLASIPGIGSRSAADLAGELTKDLEMIRRELAAGKLVELADLVGYDLCRRGEAWREMLRSLAESVRRLHERDTAGGPAA